MNTKGLGKFRHSFRFRLYFIFTATIALLTAAFTSFYVINDIKSFRTTLEREGKLLATVLAQNARLPVFAENIDALSLLAAGTARHPSVLFVAISNREGRILTSVGNSKLIKDGGIDMKVPVTSPGPVLSPETVLLGHLPVDEDRVIGEVHLHLDTSGAAERLNQLLVASIAIATVFWVVVSLLCYKILNRVTSSFNRLLAGIEEIGSGNLTARVELHGTDELERAATAINSMAASLELRELENLSLQEELLQAMKLEVQEEKKRVMARLIHTNKMTSLGLLLSSMAHEINNPNASIRFSGHNISKIWHDVVPLLEGVYREEGEFYLAGLAYPEARDALAQNAANIIENSERIARVVQGLRDYGVGGGSVNSPPSIEINNTVSAALSVLACQMKQDIQLRTKLASDIPPLRGNQQQIEQVLINLILNAMQALPDGRGEVLLTTSYHKEQSEVMVEVQDNGTGISPEVIDRLFEPFFSTKLEKGGSGLGLYISQFIVAERGGRLQLSSEPGQGTVARMVLPVEPPTI